MFVSKSTKKTPAQPPLPMQYQLK